MNIERIKPEEISKIASWLTTVFMDYPLTQAVNRNIPNAYEMDLLEKEVEVEYYVNTEDAYIVKNGHCICGILLGMHYVSSKAYHLAVMELKSHRAVKEALDKKTKKVLAENCQNANAVVDSKWQRKFLPDADYYYIKYLAVDKDQRRQGIARALLEYAVNQNKKSQTPIIIQTHSPDACSVYEKAGFKLVKVIESDKTPVKQYCYLLQF